VTKDNYRDSGLLQNDEIQVGLRPEGRNPSGEFDTARWLLQLDEPGARASSQSPAAAGHAVVGDDGALRVVGKRGPQVAGAGGALQAADVPLDLARIQAKLLGHDQGFRIVALEVGGEIDQNPAVAFDDFEAIQTAQQLPDGVGLQGEAFILRPGIASLVKGPRASSAMVAMASRSIQVRRWSSLPSVAAERRARR